MGIQIIADNRRSKFDYELLDRFEAGLVLMGSEVKSIRTNGCSIKEAYIAFMGGELFLQKSHVGPYLASSYNNHEPERLRKLLLNRNEILKIDKAMSEKGLSCVPTKVYFKKGLIKIEIALGRGKKKADKREGIKKRQSDREVSRALKHSKR